MKDLQFCLAPGCCIGLPIDLTGYILRSGSTPCNRTKPETSRLSPVFLISTFFVENGLSERGQLHQKIEINNVSRKHVASVFGGR